MYHNCGQIMNLVESYVELGVRVVEPFSPPPLGDADLGRAKALVQGRYVILSGIDQVNVLQKGSVDQVRRATEQAILAGKPHGGFILQPVDFLEYGTPPENVEAYVPRLDTRHIEPWSTRRTRGVRRRLTGRRNRLESPLSVPSLRRWPFSARGIPCPVPCSSPHRNRQPVRLLSLSPVDYVIIVLYFLVVLGIGFYLKRFTSTGEDFFMAGRKMTAWIAGVSFISANLSSLETMGWSAMAYQYGMLGAHAYFIGGALPILFLAVVMMPFYYICRTHSVPGYLKLRYGEGSRSMAGISFAAMTLLVSGSSMFAMAKILNLLLGWDMNWSILVSSLTVAVYVSLGG